MSEEAGLRVMQSGPEPGTRRLFAVVALLTTIVRRTFWMDPIFCTGRPRLLRPDSASTVSPSVKALHATDHGASSTHLQCSSFNTEWYFGLVIYHKPAPPLFCSRTAPQLDIDNLVTLSGLPHFNFLSLPLHPERPSRPD